MKINVIGLGLSGGEAALRLLSRSGVPVYLYDMKPEKIIPPYKLNEYGELVCSNSLKSEDLSTAHGVLKKELQLLNSFLINAAAESKVGGGNSLCVDRKKFARLITDKIKENKNARVICGEITELNDNDINIICSGPLTPPALIDFLIEDKNDSLYFYDAISPVIDASSIDYSKCYFKNRYDKGESADYLNCPLNEEEYGIFYDTLISLEKTQLHIEDDKKYFEGCMPIEEAARRGKQTLLFGPMKPVGLEKPDGSQPYAVVQLRKETNLNEAFNLVGFQTQLKYKEQEKLLSTIPALKKANIIRYGQLHRNTYFNSPKLLNKDLSFKKFPNRFLAGQLTGVEGYNECILTGLYAAQNALNKFYGKPPFYLNDETMSGALIKYITEAENDFKPMNANFSLIDYDPRGEIGARRKKMTKRRRKIMKGEYLIGNMERQLSGKAN